MKPYVVAIDGPAGAGKSTLAKRLAKELNIAYIDTGAMYRACALYAIESGINPKVDSPQLRSLLETAEIDFRTVKGEQKIFLNDIDVSREIREPHISTGASDISALPFVRDMLVEMQRNLAKGKAVLMDGRDIGTNVFPDAQVKVFLTADVKERANRRFLELQAKGDDSTFEKVLEDMIARDEQDQNREYAPLRQAEDAHLLDTTEMDLEQSFVALCQYTQEKLQSLI